MATDIFDLLRSLGLERYRSAIIHATPDLSPALTTFSKKIASRMNGKYLDLLDFFIQSSDLSETIDTFGPEKLKSLLIDQGSSTPLLVVDRADFLLDTWRSIERQNFFRLFINQWDGFRESMKARIIFSLQTSQEIEGLTITDSHGNSRIFHLSDFNDIP